MTTSQSHKELEKTPKNSFTAQALDCDKITPELLWSLKRIGNESVSPDGKKVLYAVTQCNIKSNNSHKKLYIYDINTGKTKKIANVKRHDSEAVWTPDGNRIGFTSETSGEKQLWEMDIDGNNRKQISFIDGGIESFKYSPQGNKVIFVKNVKLDNSIVDIYPDLPKANARIETDIMYRHWDKWHDYTYRHLFVAQYCNSGIKDAEDIMKDEYFDAPTKPFGGIEEISWSYDERLIAYTCKKKKGKEYSVSTNSEIWIYDTQTKQTTNLTAGNHGYDRNPTFSPDGTMLAWESMSHGGYESDQASLFIADIKTRTKINLFEERFEESATSLQWSSDGREIYFISDIQACDEIFKVEISSKRIERITNGVHDYKSIKTAGKMLLARKQSMCYPDDLFLVSPQDGSEIRISDINKKLLDNVKMGQVEKRWIDTTDDKKMLTWIIYPPHFDPSKKYPTLLYCQGGPQNTVSQFWSYRWNFQIMAANDYIVVAPNRRGLPGFGKDWLRQISKDYGGQNMQDYLSAIDEISKEPYVDRDHLGAVGASYGGYSVLYLAGIHNKRFKAFISHCGIFNLEQLYATTEEMWFVNWDLGGPFWENDNKIAQQSFNYSPHKLVDKWDTPIMIVHGENDYRIPYTQGMAAFNCAIMRDIPAKFLFFHDENHWVSKPQNGILWQREFFNWLNKWLKPEDKKQ